MLAAGFQQVLTDLGQLLLRGALVDWDELAALDQNLARQACADRARSVQLRGGQKTRSWRTSNLAAHAKLQKPAASNLSEGDPAGATAARPRVALALLMRRKAAILLLDERWSSALHRGASWCLIIDAQLLSEAVSVRSAAGLEEGILLGAERAPRARGAWQQGSRTPRG